MPSTEDRPLVTFFVMAYKQERHVRKAIEGAFAQTYQPLEIILSDDCSPDGTFRVMEEMAAAYEGPHRVVLNRNPQNLGIMAHVNQVMELASGDLIVDSGGDDISLPQRTERLAEAWLTDRNRFVAVHSSRQRITENGEPREIIPASPWIVDPPHSDPVFILERRACAVGAAMAWSREVFDRFGPIREDRSGVEDISITLRAAMLGDIAYVDEPLVLHREGGVSTPEAAATKPGKPYLYGRRIKKSGWLLAAYRGFLEDSEKLSFPGRERGQAICRTMIPRHEFEIALAESSRGRRLSMLPKAVGLCLREGSAVFLKNWTKYAFDSLYIPYHNLRHPSRPA